MNKFMQFYFNEDKKTIYELSLPYEGPIIRNVFNILRKKKKIGIQTSWLKIFDEIDLKTYKNLINKLARGWTSKKKYGKKNIQIIDLKEGEIDDLIKTKLYDMGIIPQTWKNEGKYHIPVYQLSNGGKIIFFDLPSENGRVYAFGMDGKANKVFEEIFGMTWKDYKLIHKKTYTQSDDNSDDNINSKEQPEKLTSLNSEEIGVIDLSIHDTEFLIKDLKNIKFKGIFKTSSYINDLGKGFKYDIKDVGTVYILVGDDVGQIIFSNKKVYDKAKKLEMLDMWLTEPLGLLRQKKPKWFSKDEINL